MQTGKSNGQKLKKTTSRLGERITNYIKENLSNELHEKKVAELFRISTSTLRHCCKAVHGISYRQYIEKQRMMKARKLIEEDGMLIKEAMAQTGYKNRATFINAFNRNFGRKPSAFK